MQFPVASSGLVDIELNLKTGKMYWADRDTCRIQRANLDGSGVEDVHVTSPNEPVGLAVDPLNQYLYWTLQGDTVGQIQRHQRQLGFDSLVASPCPHQVGLGSAVDQEQAAVAESDLDVRLAEPPIDLLV